MPAVRLCDKLIRSEAENRASGPKIDGDHFRLESQWQGQSAAPVLVHRGDDARRFLRTPHTRRQLANRSGQGRLLCSLVRSKEEPQMEAALNETVRSQFAGPSVTSRKQLTSLRPPGSAPSAAWLR